MEILDILTLSIEIVKQDAAIIACCGTGLAALYFVIGAVRGRRALNRSKKKLREYKKRKSSYTW
ncbi:MAG: hypothetical protein COA79_20195 [Planctomycetota bacterium]|nr:MAG: hypothetical protein COA79_20195 [Planctomycetota bacterium]